MEVSVSLSCLFVHEPPYQTVVVYCNSVFRRNSLCMDQPYRFLRYSGACLGSPQLHEQHIEYTAILWCTRWSLILCMYIQKLKSCIDRNTVYHKITSGKLAQCTWFKNLPDCSLKVLPLLPLVGLDTNHPNNDRTTGIFFSTL